MKSKNSKKFLEGSFGSLPIFSEPIELKLNEKWKGTKIYSPVTYCNIEYNFENFTTVNSPIYEPIKFTTCEANYKTAIDNTKYELENSKKFLKGIYSFKLSKIIKQDDQSILSQIDSIGSQTDQNDDETYSNTTIPKEEVTPKQNFEPNNTIKSPYETPPDDPAIENKTQNDDSFENYISLLKKTARISRGSAVHFLKKNNWNFQVAFEESRESKANEDSICVSVNFDELDDPLTFIFNPQQKFFLIYAEISDALENKRLSGPFQLKFKGTELIPQKLNSTLGDLGMSKEEIEYFDSSYMN